MNRRGFITSILALSAAPAIVRADSLMRIVPRDAKLIRLDNDFIYYGDGIHDDTEAIRGWVTGKRVFHPDGRAVLSIPADGSAKYGYIDLGPVYRPSKSDTAMFAYDDGPLVIAERPTFGDRRMLMPSAGQIEALKAEALA